MAKESPMVRYTEYNDRLKAQGVKMTKFSCPSCAREIETQAAPKGERWDTLANCPHCDAMYMKITDGKKAFGLIPPAAKPQPVN